VTDVTERAGRREWAGLAVLALPALLASMDLSVLFMASPWLAADLQPSGPQLLWVLDVYGFLMAGLLLTMGGLGDRIGRRRLLMVGAVAFGAASVAAAYASSTEMLIAARALLGVGGATLAPSTLALIRTMFRDGAQRTVAIGVWTAAFTSGAALGPIVGGLLLEHFWWGSVFLINVPVMAVLLAVAPLLLPESREREPGRFDLLGAAMSIAAVLLVIHGGKEIAHAGALQWGAAAALALGGLVGVLFVRRQARTPDPLIDVGLFRSGVFGAAFAAYTVMVVGSAGMGLLAVQFLQVGLAILPFAAALWQLPAVAGTVVGIAIATALGRRLRPGAVTAAGLLVAAGGFGLVALLDVGSSPAVLIGAYTVLTTGTGLVAAKAIDMIVSAAPPDRAGSAAALGETGVEFGGALGIAVLGSVASAIYRDRVAAELPAGLPPESAEAATATIGGAGAVAQQLPPAAGAAVLEGAHSAFTAAFTTTALVGAALLTVTAAVVALHLRGVRIPAATG
jgi:DHA2 family multidrug resistance protein-like MFS transporter